MVQLQTRSWEKRLLLGRQVNMGLFAWGCFSATRYLSHWFIIFYSINKYNHFCKSQIIPLLILYISSPGNLLFLYNCVPIKARTSRQLTGSEWLPPGCSLLVHCHTVKSTLWSIHKLGSSFGQESQQQRVICRSVTEKTLRSPQSRVFHNKQFKISNCFTNPLVLLEAFPLLSFLL